LQGISSRKSWRAKYLGRSVRILRKDKQTVYCDVSSRRIKIGNQKYVVGFFRDVTEQKKAEKEIQDWAKFPSENPDPVLRIAKDGTILYANKAAQKHGCNHNRKKKAVVPDVLKKAVVSSLRSGFTEEVEVECGNQIFSFVVAPIPEAGYVNIYGRNITEANAAWDSLDKTMNELV